MRALIVNDTHIGTVRRGGVTPQTALLLQQRIYDNFENLIMQHTDKDIIHAGDILDDFEVPNKDVLKLYGILSRWLEESGKRFICLRANHDWNPRGDKLSSWELLFHILEEQYGEQVVKVEDTLKHIDDNVYGIGHVANNDLFELELSKAMELENSVVIAHTNYNNPWAAESEHGLNITEEWAKEFVSRGNRLYSGHEHQKRELLGGKVVMFGSQDATSIADCLGNDAKYAHILNDDGSLEAIKTMDVTKEYISVDWTELDQVGDEQFVRVSGQVDSAQAAQVINLISRFRQRSKALLITNAVKINGASSIDEFGGVSLEEIKTFDVLESLLKELEPAQQKAVKALLED